VRAYRGAETIYAKGNKGAVLAMEDGWLMRGFIYNFQTVISIRRCRRVRN